MKYSTLDDLKVDIIAGQIMSRVIATDTDESPVSYKVLVPKAITSSGYIDTSELVTERFKSEADPKRITEIGDIVIKLTAPFDCAIVTEESAGCFIPSFCAIIKDPGQLRMPYLYAFLASKDCKEQLKSKVTGAITSILSVGKLREVEAPKPDDYVQEQIGRNYLVAQIKKRTMRRIIELEDLKNDVLFQELKNEK